MCQLREKRLDLEEATAEEKKVADTLKKELDALTKKAKVIDGALMTAEADLEAFQVCKLLQRSRLIPDLGILHLQD